MSAAWGLPATRSYTAAVSATIRSTVKRSLHAREPGLAHPPPQLVVRQQPRRSPAPSPRDRAARTSSPVTPSSTTSGMPPARVATIGLRARHRVEQRRAEAFGDRAHHEQVEALDAAEHVGAESRQQHVLLEVILAHLTLEVLAQLAFAEDDEPRVRHLAHDEVRGLDEMALALVRHERGDVADDRRAGGAARTPRAR